MKIGWQGFFGENHSWAITARNITKQLIKLNHQVDICPTDGSRHISKDFYPYLKDNNTLNNRYDLKISYTAPHNFKNFLRNADKKLGIWCSEVDKIPQSFINCSKDLDYLLAPSEWSKQTFLDSGWKENKIVKVNHGYNPEDVEVKEFPIKTNKKYKILVLIGQPHFRKNIHFIFDTLYKAFDNKSDVCIVFKVVIKKPVAPFEVDFNHIMKISQQKYPNHPETKVYSGYVDNIYSMIKSCDILYNASLGEAFNYPALDALICDKLVIAPNYGGHIDFLNQDNSLLIDGKKILAPLRSQYWEPIATANHFSPSFNDAVDKLKYGIDNYQSLVAKVKSNNIDIKKNFTWSNIVNQIMAI